MVDARVAAWDRLLRDPCAANLAHPCYSGTDSGYLVRTTDWISVTYSDVTGQTVGAATKCDFTYEITPANVSSTTGTLGGCTGSAGGTFAIADGGLSNFITITGTQQIVRRYRPVAACVKWIPSGNYTTRSGVVGMSCYPGRQGIATDNIAVPIVVASAQHKASNGSEMHEVRWLPTAVDENWTNQTALVPAGGTVRISGINIDATATSATSGRANGNLEITTVWEWEPVQNQGIVPSVVPPAPYTSQQVLSTIQDFASYVFKGLRTASSAVRSAHGLFDTMTGYRTSYNAGPAMLL